MIYDILQFEMERQQTVYMTNSYTFNRTAEVDGYTIIYLYPKKSIVNMPTAMLFSTITIFSIHTLFYNMSIKSHR